MNEKVILSEAKNPMNEVRIASATNCLAMTITTIMTMRIAARVTRIVVI